MTNFKRLTSALDGNPALQRRAALAALSVKVLADGEATTVKIGGRIEVSPGAASGAAFSLATTEANWAEFAKPVPAVGFQSLVGMQRMGHLKVDGDMVAYGRNLIFLEQLFAALRPDTPAETVVPVGEPLIEPAIGRTCGSISTAGRIGSISSKQERGSRWSACTLPAPTGGSIARC